MPTNPPTVPAVTPVPVMADLGQTIKYILEQLAAISSGGAPSTGEFITSSDQSATLPNSRELVAGVNVAFDDTVANIRTINAVSAQPGDSVQTTFLVQGGQVIWLQDYDFLVAAATYYIQGIVYNSPETSLTLNASDPTDDRIDVIAVDSNGDAVVITGTAAPNPSEPDVDPGTQLKLAIVFVPANSTEPVVSNDTAYFENAGAPTEWNWSTSGSGFNVNSSSNPKAPATKCIEGTSVSNGAYAQGQIGAGTYDPNASNFLVMYIRSKATWANNRGLTVSLRTAGVLQGTQVTINRTGSFGFDSSITSNYQLVAIPISLFGVLNPQTITQIRIAAFGNNHGFFIGDIFFQQGGTSPIPIINGINQLTGDVVSGPGSGSQTATVSTSIKTESFGFIIDGQGSPVATGIQNALRRIDANATIIGWSIMADQNGDIEFDIFADDPGSTYPPTTSIVAAAPPQLTGGTNDYGSSTTLTGWTTTIVAPKVFRVEIVSTSGTITYVVLQLTLRMG